MMTKTLETIIIKLVRKKIEQLVPELASKLPKDLESRVSVLEEKVKELDNG